MFLGMPIGYAIGVSTTICVFWYTTIPMTIIAQQSVVNTNSFPLMAIPFFMLAGNIMSTGGVAKRLMNFCRVFVGFITGGLAIVGTLASMFFGAISGSAVATTSAIGSFLIPEMTEEGYDKGFSAACCAASGTVGVIIPPSIPLVIYGVVVGASIGDLFIAGIIPGILMGLCLIVADYILCRKRGYRGKGVKPTLRLVIKQFRESFWALLSPIIILGGIYGGFFTPTEAAVVAVVYSFIIGKFVSRELTWTGLYAALLESVTINGVTTFMVGLSGAFATFLTMQRLPQKMAEALLGLTTDKILLLIIINLFLLFVGMLIDNIPATIILSPILLPIVTNFGMSPIQLGVMLTLNLAIGFITPPYGINLFVGSAVARVSMEEISRNVIWFILALIVALAVTAYFPPATMFLVNAFK
jgi:C4-dicarboxylate transporter DctM subunit